MKLGKFRIFEIIYFILVFAYGAYGLFTGTGLSGWMTKLQFDLFGVAYEKLTVILTMLLLLIPLGIARYCLEKTNLIAKATENGEPFDTAVWIKSLSAPRLAALFAAALLPAILGYGIYSCYYVLNQKELQEKIYDINLNRNPTVEIGNAHYVRLRGVLQEDLTYTIEKETSYSKRDTQAERYTPLTAENWDESVPVRFVYYSQGVVLSKLPSWFGREPEPVFDGKITDTALPVYVRGEYEKVGLKLAEDVRVVRSERFTGDQIPDRFRESYAHIFLYGGIALSAFIAFLLVLLKIQPVKGSPSTRNQ